MYDDLKEYLNWYDTRRDVQFRKDAPIIGLVLQRSHLVTGDDGHYAGVVSSMEARGAKVGTGAQEQNTLTSGMWRPRYLVCKSGAQTAARADSPRQHAWLKLDGAAICRGMGMCC